MRPNGNHSLISIGAVWLLGRSGYHNPVAIETQRLPMLNNYGCLIVTIVLINVVRRAISDRGSPSLRIVENTYCTEAEIG
jgi:hypothetical protein